MTQAYKASMLVYVCVCMCVQLHPEPLTESEMKGLKCEENRMHGLIKAKELQFY